MRRFILTCTWRFYATFTRVCQRSSIHTLLKLCFTGKHFLQQMKIFLASLFPCEFPVHFQKVQIQSCHGPAGWNGCISKCNLWQIRSWWVHTIYRLNIFELALKNAENYILSNVLQTIPCYLHTVIPKISLLANFKSIIFLDLPRIISRTQYSEQCLQLWAKFQRQVSKIQQKRINSTANLTSKAILWMKEGLYKRHRNVPLG